MKHRSSLLYAVLPAMPLLLAACGGATATSTGGTALLAASVAAPATSASVELAGNAFITRQAGGRRHRRTWPGRLEQSGCRSQHVFPRGRGRSRPGGARRQPGRWRQQHHSREDQWHAVRRQAGRQGAQDLRRRHGQCAGGRLCEGGLAGIDARQGHVRRRLRAESDGECRAQLCQRSGQLLLVAARTVRAHGLYGAGQYRVFL